MPKSIEDWVREIVHDQFLKEIKRQGISIKEIEIIAQKTVQQEITDNLKQPYYKFPKFNQPRKHISDYPPRPYLQPKKKWDWHEENYLKEQFNKMIKAEAERMNRSKASIKGKLFSLLQKSYQKV